jgi:F420H(2)-dependent quinone reductase
MLLLTTRGRISGRPHTVPLLYLRDGDLLVVVASYGGRPEHPEWFKNLVADPHVEVEIKGVVQNANATRVPEPERSRLWLDVLDAYDGYRTYQEHTDRVIPLVYLRIEETSEVWQSTNGSD